jgi:hypothetical protein
MEFERYSKLQAQQSGGLLALEIAMGEHKGEHTVVLA